MDTTEIIEGWPEHPTLRRDVIPGYTLLREVGHGASGTVYMAEESATGRSVAVKVLSSYHSQVPENLARLVRESETLQKISHPNIVKGFKHGCVADRHYFVMEYITGETVAALLRRREFITETEAMDIVEAMARGLAAAHEQRIIHRDIKPANIILDSYGVAKLMDFGLARQEFDSSLTTHGAILGTPIYISPEQARGELNLDIRTDIYSLGITLYHMVIGEPPFSEFNTSLLLTKKITDDIPDPQLRRPDLSPSLRALILRMCQRDRKRRFPDPASLLVAIQQTRQGEYPPEGEETEAETSPGVLNRIVRPEDIENPLLRSVLTERRIPTRTRFLDANEVLFYEDDTSRECYILMLGRLEVLKAGRTIARIDKCGTFIGEMSTLLNTSRTATIRSMEQSILLELTESTFRTFLQEVPEMAWHLAVTLAQRLELTNRSLKDALGKLQVVKDHFRIVKREIGE